MRGNHILLVAASIFAMQLPSAVLAQEQIIEDRCAAPNIANERPNKGGPPTEVTIGLRMADLNSIDDISQSLSGDFIVIQSWIDPRLADMDECEVSLLEIWDPGIGFRNSGRKFPSLPNVATISSNGSVTSTQRYGGTFSTYHNLRNFPFDDQRFRIWMIPLAYSDDDVVLKVDENVTGRSQLLNISDWRVHGVEGTVERMFLDRYDQYHSSYTFTIRASRITAYYVWKVILPLSLIVVMSWAVFWINPVQFGPQIGLSATSMLTLIAFLFATTNMLPELGYFTILDLFIGGATILVFLALIESIGTSYLFSIEKVKLALRIDWICRILFPLGFLVLVILVFFNVSSQYNLEFNFITEPIEE